MKKSTLLAFVTTFVAAIASTNAQIITNGGFETPDTRTFTTIYPGQRTIAPWVVGGHSVDVGDAIGNGFLSGPAFEGGQYLDLNGLGRGRITQAFPTTPGTIYDLTFAYCNNFYDSTIVASARVRVFDGLGDRLNQTVTHIGSGFGDLHWDVFTGQFTAVQKTTSLEFASLSDSNGHTGSIMLDAVEIVFALQGKLVFQGSSATLTWTGGTPPYRVQRSTDLNSGAWVDVVTNAVPPLVLTLDRDSGFYRVVGQGQ